MALGDSFTIPPLTDDPNKRGMYIIMASTPSSESYAIVYSSGGGLSTVFAGSDFTVNNTDLATSGKFNVYLSGNQISVHNLYGDRIVSVQPFVFK